MKKTARFASRTFVDDMKYMPFTTILSYLQMLQPIALNGSSVRQLELFPVVGLRSRAIFHARAALRYLNHFTDECFSYGGFVYMRTIYYNDFYFHFVEFEKYIHYV